MTFRFSLILLLALGNSSYASAPVPGRITATKPKENKPVLVLRSFANYGGHAMPMGAISTIGVRIALDAIQNASLLSDYNLEVDYIDDKMCEDGDVVAMAVNRLNSPNPNENVVPIITGPTCSDDAFIAQILPFYNYVGLAESTIVWEIAAHRRKYNSFFMTRPTFETFYEAIPAFLESNGWTRVFLLTETFTFWNPLEELLVQNMIKRNISLAGTAKVLTFEGSLPAPEHFEQAVRDLASYDDHRIIVVNTHFGAFLACWLHRYGLYGPNYVYILFGPAFFLPNTLNHVENCSEEKLVDVLRSIVYFSFGTPCTICKDAADLIGTSSRYIKDMLAEQIVNIEQNDKWFIWMSSTYSEVVAAAIQLNRTEAKLKQQNDTLLNWVTGSTNFIENGSYIHSIMVEGLNSFRYNGLNTYEKLGVNSRSGITAFFQMQQQNQSSTIFHVIPIAVYDFTPNSSERICAEIGKAIWRTRDGHPPFHALHVMQVYEPLVQETVRIIIFSLTSILLLANGILLIITLVKFKTQKVEKSLPLLNCTVLIGNILLLCFVFIVQPASNQSEIVESQCIVACTIAVGGISLRPVTFLAKLGIASYINAQNPSLAHRSSVATPARGHGAGMAIKQRHQNEQIGRKEKQSVVLIVCHIFVQLVLLSIWFGLEPPVAERIQRQLEDPENDASIAYQHYTMACLLTFNTSLSQGILSALAVSYTVAAIRSLVLTFFLRKRSRHVDKRINDIQLYRIGAYAEIVASAAGAAAIASFFSSDTATLVISVSVLVVIKVLASTTIIFVPKLVKNEYSL